jgi:hypothetical protein
MTIKPMPDELALGHLRRVIVFEPSNEQLFHKRNLTTCDAIDRLAEIGGLSRYDYVRGHTLLPLFRAVVDDVRIEDFSKSPDHRALCLQAKLSTLTTEFVRYCPDCSEEDQEFWGFSYWRRTHQVPGLDACPKHDQVLRIVAGRCLPSVLPHQCKSKTTNPKLPSCPAVDVYMEIAFGMLELTSPVPRLGLRKLIARLAMSMNLEFRSNTKLSGPFLSDRALEVFPDAWLRRHFPSLVKRRRGVPATLDTLVSQDGIRGFGDRYAFALATVAASADSALNAISQLKTVNPCKNAVVAGGA